jgi:hypothetical protein
MGPVIMAMDPTIAVALVSILTAIVTTSGGVAIAIVTNRREAENAAVKAADTAEERAESAKVEALNARLVLRDEQIAALEIQKRNRDERIARLEAEIATLKGTST